MKSKTLREADSIIHGERQDVYGNAEDSFLKVARYWQSYLENKGILAIIDDKDVALMMTLFKIAREQGTGHKADNAIDGCGYLAIYNDRLCEEEIGREELNALLTEKLAKPKYPAFFSNLEHPAELVDVEEVHIHAC